MNRAEYGRVLAGLLLLAVPFQMARAENEYEPPSSEPEYTFAFGGHVYFSADDGIHGRELWRVDVGGRAEFVKDITPGLGGTTIDQFREFKGTLYFRAAGQGDKPRLWRTDGTPSGTVRVLISPSDVDFEGVSYIGAASDRYLYFSRGERQQANFMFYTDGTAEGTHRMEDAGYDPLRFSHFAGVVCGSHFVFNAQINPEMNGVWSFDEVGGTVELLMPSVRAAMDFTAFDGKTVHFSAEGEGTGIEYWATQGTPETTVMVTDIYPGAESSIPGERALLPESGKGPRMIFAATHPKTGREIWESDGTARGTRLLGDLYPGVGSSNPYTITVYDQSVYCIATGDGIGKEMWGYRVGGGAPVVLADLNPGPAGSDPYAVRMHPDGTLFFSAKTAAHGEELWMFRSGHTAPVLVRDFISGTGSSFPYYTVPLGGRMAFVATSLVEGRELWTVNPTSGEVTLLVDLYTDQSINPSSFPQYLTPVGDLLFFAANDIAHGNELWCTDGTTEGTRLVKDILPGSASSNPEELTAVGDWLYFTADDGLHGPELWRSEGTTAGTSLTLDINLGEEASIGQLTALGRNLLFSAQDATQGEELWILEEGRQPRILADINNGPGSSSPRAFVVWNSVAYFRADDGIHGEELWRTDGTAEGTMMVRDIIEAPFEATSIGEVVVSKGQLYVAADINGSGQELWAVAEADGGLMLLRDIASPAGFGVLRRP